MKLRKHKGNKPFVIAFQTRSFPIVAHKGNVGGYERRGESFTAIQFVHAEGVSAGAVRAGFLFGRDRGNTLFNIHPA